MRRMGTEAGASAGRRGSCNVAELLLSCARVMLRPPLRCRCGLDCSSNSATRGVREQAGSLVV